MLAAILDRLRARYRPGLNACFSRCIPVIARSPWQRASLKSLAIGDACNIGARHFHMGEPGVESWVKPVQGQVRGDSSPVPCPSIDRPPVTAADRQLRATVNRSVVRAKPDSVV